jgi:uncharacterized protein
MRKFLFFLFLFPFLTSYAQKEIPELWDVHVHDDEAHVLSKSVVDELETKLTAFEDSTSNQIAILIVSSLNGEVLEEYGLKVSEKWQLGQKDKDNGALLLIAIDDRKMRIEAGIGLEGVLTDAMCSRIIRNELAPNFREGNFDQGVRAAIDAMIAAIGGEYTADEPSASNAMEIADLSWQEKLGLGAFIFGILGIFTFLGLFIPGCAGWFLYAFLIPFYATFPMVILGVNGGITALILYAVGFPIIKLILGKTPAGKRLGEKMGRGGKGGSGGWSSGSGWSSGWGGGSSSGGGGGFSGGGGSFGGGGASGSW